MCKKCTDFNSPNTLVDKIILVDLPVFNLNMFKSPKKYKKKEILTVYKGYKNYLKRKNGKPLQKH